MGLMVGEPTFTAEGVGGAIEHGETIVISALGGESFGTKPDPASRGTAKPICVWRSEDNALTPNSTLGDVSAFNTALNGNLDTSVKATNSVRSYRADLDPGADPIEGYTFHLNVGDWDDFYVFRREYWTQTNVEGEMARTRTSAGDTGLVSVGEWGRSQVSPNEYGQIDFVTGPGESTALFWNRTAGSIGDQTGDYTNFTGEGVNGDLDVYATEAEASSGSGTIIETFTLNDGFFGNPFRDFNNKNIRFSYNGGNNNAFTTSPYTNRSSAAKGSAKVENTGDGEYTTWANRATHVRSATEWIDMEWTFSWGTVNTADSEMLVYFNGVCGYTTTEKKFIFSTTANPNKFNTLKHIGNDNLFNKGTSAHVDYFYVDDSLCQVFIADSATLNIDSTTSTTEFNIQPCPIIAWADGEITCVVQKGQLPTFAGAYIHVRKSDGTVESSRVIS